ncbi:hypothetical protein CP157_03559 (plasmid) [Paracoccus marcusii]|uniref:Stf0 family sulfotransferase n=1 Tax=Paracoccus marcusii TaxID=59779 RepID=UPI001C3E46E5|nr:Stf0 family sulfotransferase [Paracoccus marcusii]QXI65767.1 hypothetical protein CP157_03559 [Paracoccus marcusii]
MPTNIFRSLRQRMSDSLKEISSPTDAVLLDQNYLTSFHRVPIERYFEGRVIFPHGEQVFSQPLIVLAFTNRSGSNLLAEFLRQTNLMSGFGEYLNRETVIKQSKQNKIRSFPDYLQFLGLKLTRDGQAFGVKASAEQLKILSDWNIHRMFSQTYVVHIRRDDILRQAISHWIAWQTGQWTSLQPKRSVELTFDGSKIMKIVSDVIEANNAIHIHCARQNLNYISVSYQEVIADPKAVVSRIFDFTELDISNWNPVQPRLSKQSDGVNDVILEKLLEYVNNVESNSEIF